MREQDKSRHSLFYPASCTLSPSRSLALLLSLPYSLMQPQAHTHTCTYTHMHTYACTHMHIHTHTHTHTAAHICTHSTLLFFPLCFSSPIAYFIPTLFNKNGKCNIQYVYMTHCVCEWIFARPSRNSKRFSFHNLICNMKSFTLLPLPCEAFHLP